jgi:S-layer protein
MSTYTEAEIQAREAVAELYIGLFGRATDPDGLDYWVNELVTGNLTEEQVRANFVNDQPEWEDGLGALTNEQLVFEMYGYLFEREPDEAGYAYWVNELDTGSVNADQLVFALINGAGLEDRRVLDYKVEASLYFSDNYLEADDEWVIEGGRQAATAAVDGVEDRASTDASKASTDSGGDPAAETFDLQVGADDIAGTQGGDLIRATAGDGWNAPTLDAFDEIDGGLGFDRLELAVQGDLASLPTFTTIENVESVVVGLGTGASLGGAGTLDLSGIVGAESLVITGDRSGNVDVLSAVSGEVSIGEFASARGVGGNVTIEDYSATSFSVLGDAAVTVIASDADSIVVDSGGLAVVAAGDVTATVVTADGDALVSVSDAGTIFVDAGEDVNVDAGDVTAVDVTASGVANIFASDVGEVVVDAGGNVVIGALGVDTVTVDAGGDVVDVDVSDVDTVTVDAGGDVYITASTGSIGSVDVEAGERVFVSAMSDGATVGDVVATASRLEIDGSDGVGNVDVTLEGFDVGEDADTDVNIHAHYGAVGNVSVDATSDSVEGYLADISVVVAGSDGVGSIDIDIAGSNSSTDNEYVDLRVYSGTADAVAIAFDNTSDATLSVGVNAYSSASDAVGPTAVSLALNGVTSDDQLLYVDFGNQEAELTHLDTITVTGNSNISMDAAYDALIPTLTTIDAGAVTGNVDLYFGVGKSDADTALDVTVTTGRGDDFVGIYADDVAGSDESHGDVTVSTGAGDDEVTNNDSLPTYVGTMTVDLGSGDDTLYLTASDATINVTGGAGDDEIEVESRSINSNSEWVGEIVLDIDAGEGDDFVEVSTVNASVSDSAIDLGTGDNTLHYNFVAPGASSLLSDSDVEAFDVTMGGNVSGDLHTLILETDIDISDDATLDISGLGDVSVLKMGETELTDSEGATLTVEGAAADFTIDVSHFSTADDLGEATSTAEQLDDNIMALSTPGVESLHIIGSDEIGVLLSADANTSLESLVVTGDNDTIDLALVGFDNGLDVTVTTADDSSEADAFVFGGTYGAISVGVTSGNTNADAAVVIEASNTDAEVDLGDYTTTISSVTVSSQSTDSTQAEGAAILHLDGHSVSDGIMGVGTVSIDDVSLTGNFNTQLHVDDFSDGSTVTLGDIDLNINVSDEQANEGGITLAGNAGAAITLGNISVDVSAISDVGNASLNWTNALWITDDEGSTITAGNIDVTWSNQSDAYADSNVGNEIWVGADNLSGSNVVVGDIHVDAAGQDVYVSVTDSVNSSVTLGDVDIAGTYARVLVADQLAETDGTDINIVIGDVTLHDTTNDGEDFFGPGPGLLGPVPGLLGPVPGFGAFGGEDGLSLVIADNTDDFSAGTVSVEVGDVSMTGSDSAFILIEGNQGETDVINSLSIVPAVGVQVDLGDVDISVEDAASIYTVGNAGTHVVMGDVNVELGSDNGYGTFASVVAGNFETVVAVGDTSVTIGTSDGYGGYGYTQLTIADNDTSEVTFGDYDVTVGSSDGYVGYGYHQVAVADNSDSEITLGDVSILNLGVTDVGLAVLAVTDNNDSTITIGDVTLDGGSLSAVVIDDNSDSTITIGDVSLTGAGGIAIYDNTDSTIEIGAVVQEGSSDSLGGYNADLGLAIVNNGSDAGMSIAIESFTSTLGYSDAEVLIDNNDDVSITIGDIKMSDMDTVDFLVSDNENATIHLDDVTLSAADNVSFTISDNNFASITISDVTLSASSVSVDISDNEYATVTVGDIDVTADSSFDLDVTGSNTDEVVTLGDISVDLSDDGSTVDIYLDTVRGAEVIDIDLEGSDMGDIYIDVDTDPYFGTTLNTIDLSGANGSDNSVDIDLLDANLGSDVEISFGDFGTANVYTDIDDDRIDGAQDGEGVRQTYVFEGSDIGNIEIGGFVAGAGAARDVDLGGTDGVLLRTDRLDLSAFDGATLDDLVFDYSDLDDAVIITSDLFDGSIVVTGQGVDSDNGEQVGEIIDRVQDSIIFG